MSDISGWNNINIYIIMEIQPQSTSSLIFKFFVFIGLFFILKKIYNFVSWIYKSFLLPPVDFKNEYGDGWAVITGGSDGIGFAFAEEFLKQNLKICIIARNEEKIKKVIEQLKEKYKNGNVKYIVWDFDKRYTNEEINELTGITVNGKPTIAAVMEFSNYPQAYFPQIVINATVVPGYEIGDTNSDGNRFTDNVKITGPIDDMINQAVSFVKRNIRKSVSFNEYGQRKDIYE